MAIETPNDTREDTGENAPAPNQPYTELLDMMSAQAASEEPVVERPATLHPVGDGEWRFLTRDGIANTSITLRLPVLGDDIDENAKRKNVYKRWLDRQVRQTEEGRKPAGAIYRSEVGKDGMLKADKAVFDITGEYQLRFHPARDVDGKRRKIAEFVTRDKTIAAYIRGRLERGEFAGEIKEDVRPMEVEINGQRIKVMPADDSARLAMAAAAAG